MNRKMSIEACTLMDKYENELKAHLCDCKHGVKANRREEENNDPLFHKDVWETCEWCGSSFKNGTIWKNKG